MRFIILLGHITVIGFGQELGFLIFASVERGQFQKSSSKKLDYMIQSKNLINMNG